MSSHLCRSLRPILITLGLIVSGWAVPAWSATWTVRPGQSIQAAIDQAQSGDVVEIERAVYTERLLIAKPLTLRGLTRPTISGANQGDTIRITSPDVVIEGLIVRDSGDSLLAQELDMDRLAQTLGEVLDHSLVDKRPANLVADEIARARIAAARS